MFAAVAAAVVAEGTVFDGGQRGDSQGVADCRRVVTSWARR